MINIFSRFFDYYRRFGKKYLIFVIVFVTSYAELIKAINYDDERAELLDNPNDFESIVYIDTGNKICTGTLINHRTVITAAHCYKDGEKAKIYLGNEIKTEEGFEETSSFIVYPDNKRYFGFTGASYDLALISLKEPLGIKAIEPDKSPQSLGEDVYLSGYGLYGTGSNPDQGFDKTKRWGTNNLEDINEEDFFNGKSFNFSQDKEIYVINFDKNQGSLESMISLGDSGSPLLIKKDDSFFLIGIASWTKKNSKNERGYGTSAGFTSIEQNYEWIKLNNPLRNVTSTGNGSWIDEKNWEESRIPNNNEPSAKNYSTKRANYYSVNLKNLISLNDEITLDVLNIELDGYLILQNRANLDVLLSTSIDKGVMKNEGKFKSTDLSIYSGTFINNKEVDIRGNILMNEGEFTNNSNLYADEISILGGNIAGTGIFRSSSFNNRGFINPGLISQSIGTLTFKTHLINKGVIEFDLNNKNENDFLKVDKITFAGSISLNPLSESYNGNSKFTLFHFEEIEGNILDLKTTKDKFGRLRPSVFIKENSVDLILLNPKYRDLGLSKKSSSIGQYIDDFSLDTSSNFQQILDTINYIADNENVSKGLENIVLEDNYEHSIERILLQNNNFTEGIFIENSRYSSNKENLRSNSDVKSLNINYKGFGFRFSDIDSDIHGGSLHEFASSQAVHLHYKHTFSLFDVFFDIYKERTDTFQNRTLLASINSGFIGYHSREISFEKKMIGIEKLFESNFLNVKAGTSFSRLNVKTDPFQENLNGVKNNYRIDGSDFDILLNYLDFSKGFYYGKNNISLGLEFKKIHLMEDSYTLSVEIDNAESNLIMNNSLELDQNVLSSFYISSAFNESLYTKLSYSERNNNPITSVKIGYLF